MITCVTLSMLVAGAASSISISHNYQYFYAASKNSTKSTSSSSTTTSSSTSSSSKGKNGSAASNNSTAPIGSKTFLTVTTKVSGGTGKPSDFAINVAGKSPSPKSFSGSSSDTSVTFSAGKYKVTASGPTGYTTKYSSGCSGTASGGTPVKCIVTGLFSTSPSPRPSGSNSTSVKTENAVMHLIIVDKANCNLYTCPALGNTVIKVYDEDNKTSGSPRVLKSIDPATQNHYDVNAPIGHKITTTAGVVEFFPEHYENEVALLITPPYSGKQCGVNKCTLTMPAPGPGPCSKIIVVLTTRLDNKAREIILNLATAITIAHFHKGRKRLPDLKAIVPPPKWKMAIVAFIGAYCISLLASACDWT